MLGWYCNVRRFDMLSDPYDDVHPREQLNDRPSFSWVKRLLSPRGWQHGFVSYGRDRVGDPPACHPVSIGRSPLCLANNFLGRKHVSENGKLQVPENKVFDTTGDHETRNPENI